MVVFLYGPDSYRRQEKLNEYKERYKNKYASGAENFYLDKDNDFGRFKSFCKAQSLFEPSRLGIISDFYDLEKAELKDFNKIIKDNLENKDLTLILISNKKPNKIFSYLLDKPVNFHAFENLEGAALGKFTDAEIKKRGLELDDESRNIIMLAYGGDIWGLVSELDKLALLDPIRDEDPLRALAVSNGASEKKISRRILEAHADISLPVKLYPMMDDFYRSTRISDRLFLLEELFANSGDTEMLFNFLATIVRGERDKQKMADYNAAVRSGKLEYEEVFLDFAIRA